MKYYIGIDGGGTKTACCIFDETGRALKHTRYGNASYKQIGMNGVLELLQNGIHELTDKLPEESVFYTCFGMPGLGESRTNDGIITARIAEELAKYHIKTVNDCEVGWSGSLLLEPGINVVAGTGTIAYGKNPAGQSVRVGGWSSCYSDEGSGKWLGVRCMELFSKQSDGRMEKGPLYRLVKEHFGITEDVDVIDLFEKEYQPYRDKTASLQRVLFSAAKAGDKSAIRAYASAAFELALILKAACRRLGFGSGCKISYSGGVFKTGDLLLEPLKKEMSDYDIQWMKPACEPVEGAGLLARYYEDAGPVPKEFIENIKKNTVFEKQDANP